MPAWSLKLFAAAITALSALGSSGYVAAHVHDAQAPLHPKVAAGGGLLASLSAGGAAPAGAPSGGRLHLSPSVQMSEAQPPLTFTSVS